MNAISKSFACCALGLLLGLVPIISAQTVSTSKKRIQDPEAATLNDLLVKAQSAMDRKDYDAAAQSYQEYLAKRPDDAASHFQLGYAYTALHQPAGAKVEYEKAIELDPKMFAAYLNLGLTLLDTDPGAAIGPLEKATELFPDDAMPKFLLGSALERTGKLPLAIAKYQAAEKIDGKNFDVRLALGHALLASDQAPAAEAEFRAALELQATSAPARLGLAKSLITQKKPGPAAVEYAAYLALDPADNQARIERASALVDTGEDDAALAEIDRAGPASQENLHALKMRTLIAFHKKRYDDAIPPLQKAILLAPRDPDLTAQLGHAYLEKKDYPVAVNELIVAFKMDPNSVDVLSDLVTAQYLNRNYPAALQGLDLLSQRKTLPPGSWFVRAFCYDKIGQPFQALDAYKKFLQLNTDLNNDMYFEASARVRTLTRELKDKKR